MSPVLIVLVESLLYAKVRSRGGYKGRIYIPGVRMGNCADCADWWTAGKKQGRGESRKLLTSMGRRTFFGTFTKAVLLDALRLDVVAVSRRRRQAQVSINKWNIPVCDMRHRLTASHGRPSSMPPALKGRGRVRLEAEKGAHSRQDGNINKNRPVGVAGGQGSGARPCASPSASKFSLFSRDFRFSRSCTFFGSPFPEEVRS